MSKKSRKSKSKKVKKIDPDIDYDSWFWFKVKEDSVKDWQKKEIRVFFNSKGLKDKETKLKYDETLKLY